MSGKCQTQEEDEEDEGNDLSFITSEIKQLMNV